MKQWSEYMNQLHFITYLLDLYMFLVFGVYITKTRLFKYFETFTTKNWKFSDKTFWYFSYSCAKHRLWVLVRTARRGGSNEYLQSIFLGRNKKNDVYPCKP